MNRRMLGRGIRDMGCNSLVLTLLYTCWCVVYMFAYVDVSYCLFAPEASLPADSPTLTCCRLHLLLFIVSTYVSRLFLCLLFISLLFVYYFWCLHVFRFYMLLTPFFIGPADCNHCNCNHSTGVCKISGILKGGLLKWFLDHPRKAVLSFLGFLTWQALRWRVPASLIDVLLKYEGLISVWTLIHILYILHAYTTTKYISCYLYVFILWTYCIYQTSSRATRACAAAAGDLAGPAVRHYT